MYHQSANISDKRRAARQTRLSLVGLLGAALSLAAHGAIAQPGGNLVIAEQLGWGNQLTVTQSGTANRAYTGQVGWENEIVLHQIGSGLLAGILQFGYDNRVALTQQGSGLLAGILQVGYGHRVEHAQDNSEPTFFSAQWGSNNTIITSQTGQGLSLLATRVVQWGDGLSLAVIQHAN